MLSFKLMTTGWVNRWWLRTGEYRRSQTIQNKLSVLFNYFHHPSIRCVPFSKWTAFSLRRPQNGTVTSTILIHVKSIWFAHANKICKRRDGVWILFLNTAKCSIMINLFIISTSWKWSEKEASRMNEIVQRQLKMRAKWGSPQPSSGTFRTGWQSGGRKDRRRRKGLQTDVRHEKTHDGWKSLEAGGGEGRMEMASVISKYGWGLNIWKRWYWDYFLGWMPIDSNRFIFFSTHKGWRGSLDTLPHHERRMRIKSREAAACRHHMNREDWWCRCGL